MKRFSHYKVNLFLILFLVLLLPVVFLQSQNPQSLLNFAKENQVSDASAQISLTPTKTTQTNNNFTKDVLNTVNTVNVVTHSFIYDTFLIIFSGIFFCGLFILLVKKFL
ncbi:hypothetical protein HY345_01540 [Candidatus Microgenomates bacterium]|nr:hypothetical protein [Candidatus Microgenomates bacterium]